MKIEEIKEFLSGFKRSQCSAKGIGCVHDLTFRTSTVLDGITPVSESTYRISEALPENIVETHFNQIKDALAKHEGFVIYVRTMPDLIKVLDDDGEFTGHYVIRTRLQFGEEGKCITMEQREHLLSLGWSD